MKLGRIAVAAGAVAVAGVASSAPAARQAITGPVATYWMSAETTSGMGGMSQTYHRPSMAEMMRDGNAGRNPYGDMNANAYTHSLILQLGSGRRPQGAPQAEHDPPQGLGAGPVLPLITPQAQAAHEEAEPGPPPQYQAPRGRLLVFWGCGEHAGPGQPYVLDFARLGQAGSQQFAALTRGLGITPMTPPSPSRNATYGEWPNAESRTTVPQDGSLQGAHVVRGNYTPDINFTLAAGQDFLPPFRVTTNVKNPTGSATLGWRPVDGSQGYIATMFGSQGGGDIVMWVSSAVQASSFSLPDYLSDGEIARLVANHVLMPPSQLNCTIPIEAVQAAGQAGSYRLLAYGGETNISYPPRPPAPQPWNIAWQVKICYRAQTTGIVGMDLAAMMGGGQAQQGQQPPPQQQKPKHSNPLGGLGGILP